MPIAQMLPNAAREVLIGPLATCFLAWILYFCGKSTQRKPVTALHWAGIALMALSLFLGMRYLWQMWEPGTGAFYRAGMEGRSLLMVSHYVVVIVPLASLITQILGVRRKRRAVLED